MPREKGVWKVLRVWLSVGTSVLIGAAGTACTGAGDGDADATPGQTAGEPAAALSPATKSAGGEGEGASTADPRTDDVEYLHRLGQARGHLVAFVALHRLGEHRLAMTHAKHPESELYSDLVPAFAVRGMPGFARELAALAAAVENGGEVDAAYADVQKAIRANRPDVDAATQLMAVAALARTAAAEFAIGVADDGTVVNAHEYQDAYGFLTAARELLTGMQTEDAAEENARVFADEQLQIALDEFDALTAQSVDGTAAAIHGAAARIEIEATALP